MPAGPGTGLSSGLSSAAIRAAVVGLALLLGACQVGRDFSQVGGASARGAGYINDIRTSNGLTPLAADARLEVAAQQQAAYMARSGRMAHTTGRGRDFATRMSDNGVGGPAAENIAHGRMDLEKLFSMWMNSQGHRRNMLDPRFSRFGLAYADEASGGRKYWALVLGQ
jgi:uncharacterized protein YkwD